MPAIEDKAVAETAALDDDEFLHSLCTYAGDTEAWARFDRSAWLSVEVEAAEEEADQENGQASNNEDDGSHEGETSLALNNVVWPETGLAMGDLSADGDIFVSWDLVEGYPTMFVGKKNSRRVSRLRNPSQEEEKSTRQPLLTLPIGCTVLYPGRYS
jgi:hypothetical protein